jgi:hypothetical protein
MTLTALPAVLRTIAAYTAAGSRRSSSRRVSNALRLVERRRAADRMTTG